MKLEKTALLVIDMQNSFVEEGSPNEIKPINRNLGKIKEFIDFCREKGIEVIYTRHGFDPKKNIIEAKLFTQEEMEDLRNGTHGWEIHDKIKPKEGEVVIDKNKYDAFFKTNLEEVLKSKGIENLIITGTITQVCCESTARSAMFHDYNVFFISDLNFSFDEELHNRTLEVFKRNFGEVLSSEKIKSRIDSKK